MSDKLNPGIVKVVELINSLGYRTTDSGDGETHDHECDRDVGYVVMVLSDDQPLVESADRIAKALLERGVVLGVEPGQVMIQANYSPMDEVSLVDIHGIHDRMLS